jgi:hypothetical protein
VLREAGLVYEARDKDDLALSAFQSALFVTLTVAIESKSSAVSLAPAIAELLERVPAEHLHYPVKELLATLAALS